MTRGWYDPPIEQPGNAEASNDYLARLWREHKERTMSMTFAELNAAIAQHFGPTVSYSIDVEMWRHAAQAPGFKWKLWAGRFWEAPTPEALLAALLATPSSDEPIEATSARLADVATVQSNAAEAEPVTADDVGF